MKHAHFFSFRSLLLTLAVLPLLLGSVSSVVMAEVVMVLDMPRTNFMQHEPVYVELTLRNNAGQALIFGGEAELRGAMHIELTDVKGHPLPTSDTSFPLKGMILKPGADYKLKIDISRFCDVSKIGLYQVKLYITHPMLDNAYESNRRQFDVMQGKVFWTRRVGVPNFAENRAADSGDKVKIRTYSILGLQDKQELYYYLMIEDDSYIYSLSRIGKALGHEGFQCEIDMLSRLHLLIPISAKVFHYQVFDWNGEKETNKIYRTAEQMPRLFRDPQNGVVDVVGGEQAQLGVDYTEERLLPEDFELESSGAAEITPNAAKNAPDTPPATSELPPSAAAATPESTPALPSAVPAAKQDRSKELLPRTFEE